MKTKTSIISTNKDVSVLEKYIQVVPNELLDALKKSAAENGISLDMEIAARLNAYIAEPELGNNALSQKILKQKFTHKEAVAECNHRRHAMLYLYEMEKLRLFLRFERKLPRNIKENFIVIDVKISTKQIKAELAAEDQVEQGE